MSTHHIIHHNDLDGIASAAIVYEMIKATRAHTKTINNKFYKVDYTADLSTMLTNVNPGDTVYCVDYSFSNYANFKFIKQIAKTNTVIWIDHHATSIDLLKESENMITLVDTKYCATVLCYVFARAWIGNKTSNTAPAPTLDETDIESIPLFIRYVDSWDTWKHNMPSTTEFNYGMRSIKYKPTNLFSMMLSYNSKLINNLFSLNTDDIKLNDTYMQKFINNVIDKGTAIKTYMDIDNEALCNSIGFETKLIINTADMKEIYNIFVVNKRQNSAMFGDRINYYDIVVGYNYNGDFYIYSLYTAKPCTDCSVIAKFIGDITGCGGGGHPGAAGFQCKEPIFHHHTNTHIVDGLFGKKKIITKTNK